MSNPQVEPVELTGRVCRYCRQPYVAPKGERWHACRVCAPTPDDAIDGRLVVGGSVAADVRSDPSPPRRLLLLDAASGDTFALPDDGIPF